MAQIGGEGSTEFITCIQGQAKEISRQPILVPISKGILQDVLQSFGVQESQGDKLPLYLAPPWEIFFLMFPGELRNFLPPTLADLDLHSRERNLSGHLVESWVSGFTIHLRIELTSAEKEVLMGAMGVNKMERIHGGE